MTLRKFIEENESDWVGYHRPAVDWMVTVKGRSNDRLVRSMHDFPQFAEVVKQIPRPLSRQMVFDCYKEDLYKGYVATLLWENFRQDPFPIYHYLPFLATPPDEVREKLKKIQDRFGEDELDLAELFDAMNNPEKLMLAPKINHSRFSLALDFLSHFSDKTVRPLIFNPHMMTLHCALLLEDIGEAQPYYDYKDRVSVKESASVAKCYEDYCQRVGDIALWAGSGNPELLVDWMNYDEEGKLAYSLAMETITRFRRKGETRFVDNHIPYWSAISLADYLDQGFLCTGDENESIAQVAAELYLEDATERDIFIQILKDNGLIENRTQYANYNSRNKGCNKENPFSLCSIEEDEFKFEKAIVDYLIYWTSPKETHRELCSVTMHCRGSKMIESFGFNVYRRDEKPNRRIYYFNYGK